MSQNEWKKLQLDFSMKIWDLYIFLTLVIELLYFSHHFIIISTLTLFYTSHALYKYEKWKMNNLRKMPISVIKLWHFPAIFTYILHFLLILHLLYVKMRKIIFHDKLFLWYRVLIKFFSQYRAVKFVMKKTILKIE